MKTLITTITIALTFGLFGQGALADVNGCYIHLPQGCPMHPSSYAPGYFDLDSYGGAIHCKRRAHDYLEWCNTAPSGVIRVNAYVTTFYNKNGQWTSAFGAYRSAGTAMTSIFVRAGGTEADEYVGGVAGRP